MTIYTIILEKAQVQRKYSPSSIFFDYTISYEVNNRTHTMKYEQADVVFSDSVEIPKKPVLDFLKKNFNSSLYLDDPSQRVAMHFSPRKVQNRFRELQKQGKHIIPITDDD